MICEIDQDHDIEAYDGGHEDKVACKVMASWRFAMMLDQQQEHTIEVSSNLGYNMLCFCSGFSYGNFKSFCAFNGN